MQLTNMRGTSFINKSQRLSHKVIFFEKAMEKCVTYIELSKRPVIVSSQGQDDANSKRFYYGTEHFVIINPGLLVKTLSHKTGFIPRDQTIRMPFDLVYPSTPNNVMSGRRWNKRPCLLPLKSLKLRGHSLLPFRNLGSNSISGRFGLKVKGSGSVEGLLFGNTRLGSGLHGMRGSMWEWRSKGIGKRRRYQYGESWR